MKRFNVLGVATILWLTGSACSANAELLTAAAQPQSIQALCRPTVESPCVARVGASLRNASSGQPLPGKTLVFVSKEAVICSSVTDDAGSAACYGVAPSGRDFAEVGYRVVFTGDGHFEAASAQSQ